MPIDASLVGRSFPPTRPFEVSSEKVRELAAAIGVDPDGPVPPTLPVVVAFEAMNAFLDAVEVDLSRIVHGEQSFRYRRPVRVGDRLTATLTVTTVRQIAGNDIVGTTSAVHDAAGDLVCETSATLVHRAAA